MILFFDSSISAEMHHFQFNKEESKHLSKVLRKKEGDFITITNGKGGEWRGKLTDVVPQKSLALQVHFQQHPKPVKRIHLAIAPTKNNTRMEWLVEKITELGVASITPLLCEHSERKVIKTDRFEKIAIAALKQSQQFFIPKINTIIRFEDFLNQNTYPSYIAHCQNTEKLLLAKQSFSAEDITVMIGPEGDFSSTEINLAITKGVLPVTLGPQRFRTETAALIGSYTLFLQQLQNSHL